MLLLLLALVATYAVVPATRAPLELVTFAVYASTACASLAWLGYCVVSICVNIVVAVAVGLFIDGPLATRHLTSTRHHTSSHAPTPRSRDTLGSRTLEALRLLCALLLATVTSASSAVVPTTPSLPSCSLPQPNPAASPLGRMLDALVSMQLPLWVAAIAAVALAAAAAAAAAASAAAAAVATNVGPAGAAHVHAAATATTAAVIPSDGGPTGRMEGGAARVPPVQAVSTSAAQAAAHAAAPAGNPALAAVLLPTGTTSTTDRGPDGRPRRNGRRHSRAHRSASRAASRSVSSAPGTSNASPRAHHGRTASPARAGTTSAGRGKQPSPARGHGPARKGDEQRHGARAPTSSPRPSPPSAMPPTGSSAPWPAGGFTFAPVFNIGAATGCTVGDNNGNPGSMGANRDTRAGTPPPAAPVRQAAPTRVAAQSPAPSRQPSSTTPAPPSCKYCGWVNPNHTPEFCRRKPRPTATGPKAPSQPSPRQAPSHPSAAPTAHTGASYAETASKAAATATAAATASRLAAAAGSAASATSRSTDRPSASNGKPHGQAKGISALTAAGEWAYASGKHLFSGDGTGNDCMIDCIRLAVWGKRSPAPLQHLKVLRDAVLDTIAAAPAVLGNACYLATGITITGASQLRVLSALAESQSGSTRSGRMGELEDLCAFVRIVFQGRLGIRVWALSTTGTATDPE